MTVTVVTHSYGRELQEEDPRRGPPKRLSNLSKVQEKPLRQAVSVLYAAVRSMHGGIVTVTVTVTASCMQHHFERNVKTSSLGVGSALAASHAALHDSSSHHPDDYCGT